MSTAWTIAPGVSRIITTAPLGQPSEGVVATTGNSSIIGQPEATYQTSAGTSTQITGLTPGRSYRIQVRAVDASGNSSAWSTEIILAMPTGSFPGTVAATSTVPSPTLSVGVSPTVVGFGTVAGTASVPAPAVGLQRTVTTAATSTALTNLSGSSTYQARVRARDAAGNWSAFSAPINFSTTNTPTPATVAAVASVPPMAIGGVPPVLAMIARPVVRGGSVTLDVQTTPPGAATVTGYSWQIIAGGGSLTNATTATPTYTAPASGSGLATARVTVMTSNGGQATADLALSYHATIVGAENALTGTVRTTWDLESPNLGGISTLQGFCDGFSGDKGSTLNFKIAQSDTAGWSAEVYRLGYYGGAGARSYGVLAPSSPQVAASQAQPAPSDADPDTTLLSADCSAWATTLTWTPPAWAPSGIYILRLNRTGGGASHITFVVRDDARRADLTVMPSDSTWNAYNAWGGMGGGQYGGNSLYYGVAVNQYHEDCARYVSYNRPVVNRGAADSGRTYGAVKWSTFFTSEYPMVRFLERNGIDVKYYGCLDAAGDPTGTHLTGNGGTRGGSKAAMMIGHNEYWSNGMRSGWEAAIAAGVSVFTCASNEVFWRLVGSVNDAQGRPRIWECYKSTIASRASTGRAQWTGSWRDPDGAGKGGNQPENSFTGTIFAVNGPDTRPLVVPATGGFSAQPIWRHTSVASLTAGQSYSSGSEILGFEWDVYGPAAVTSNAGAFMAQPDPRTRYCSNATYAVSNLLLDDAGDVYTSGNATHRLVVKPGGNGGMVFGTGTMNWAFGLDSANTYQVGLDNVTTVLQQATINMLVDMGAPPATLMSGLTEPTAVDWFVDAGMSTVATGASIPSFSIITGSSSNTVPLSVTALASVPAPGVQTGTVTAPGVVAGSSAIPTPAVTAGTGAAVPSLAVATTAAAPTAQLRTGSTVAAAALNVAATAPAIAVTAGTGASVSTLPVQAVSTIATFGSEAGSNLPLPTVSGGSEIPPMLLRTGSRALPQSVAAVAAVVPAGLAAGSRVQPGPVAGLAAVPVPEVETGSSADVGLVLGVAATAAVGTMTFLSRALVQMQRVAGEADVLAPGIISGSATTINLDDVEAVADIRVPIVSISSTSTPATSAGIAAIPALSVRLGASGTLSVVSATAAVPQPQTSAQAGSGVGLASVSTQATVPPMLARVGSSATAQHVGAQATVPTLAVRLTLVVRPTTITATVAVWQPSLGASTVVQLTAVLARATVPPSRLLMVPLVFAHPHSVRMSRSKGQITMKRRI